LGFTLIELLVVIAIIALLVSILLPSLKKAKDLAKAVACQSNLRNLHMAAAMYANTHNGATPQAPRFLNAHETGSDNGRELSYPVILAQEKLVPFHDDPNLSTVGGFLCPNYIASRTPKGWEFDPDGGEAGPWWPRYVEQGNDMARPRVWRPGSNGYNSKEFATFSKALLRNDIERPSEFLMLGELNKKTPFEKGSMFMGRKWIAGEGWVLNNRHYEPWNNKRPKWADTPYPHGGKVNVVLWDGHVERSTYDEIHERGWGWDPLH
jgi:prepilin-type N-terminal cleavage/methylation domain-containing protein/prepilin-type processing-associated H-X9-DG protein